MIGIPPAQSGHASTGGGMAPNRNDTERNRGRKGLLDQGYQRCESVRPRRKKKKKKNGGKGRWWSAGGKDRSLNRGLSLRGVRPPTSKENIFDYPMEGPSHQWPIYSLTRKR